MGLLTRMQMAFEAVFGVDSPAVDYGGVVTPKITPLDVRWPDGTTDGKASRVWGDYQATIAAGATRNLDLRALTDAFGLALSLVEVRAIGIYVKRTLPADALTIAKGAANGWTALGANYTQLFQGGTWVWIVCPVDGAYPTTASNKVLDISNATAAPVTYDIVVIGVHA